MTITAGYSKRAATPRPSPAVMSETKPSRKRWISRCPAMPGPRDEAARRAEPRDAREVVVREREVREAGLRPRRDEVLRAVERAEREVDVLRRAKVVRAMPLARGSRPNQCRPRQPLG